ncbi:MAG: hypothetical protein COB53_01505 [Elusimicrobia bacterium]|nr:MAG: hypothetical protein COB53_01505 [Elusimicrobiota bacterium]
MPIPIETSNPCALKTGVGCLIVKFAAGLLRTVFITCAGPWKAEAPIGKTEPKPNSPEKTTANDAFIDHLHA